MSGMFSNCSSLESIDLFSFNTTNVNDMSFMFYECSSLKSANLSSFVINTNNKVSMFQGCKSLKIQNVRIKSSEEKLIRQLQEDIYG